jgi:hypothetical protein
LRNIDVSNVFRVDSTWGRGRNLPNGMRHMMIKVIGLMFVIYEILLLYHPPSPPTESGAGLSCFQDSCAQLLTLYNGEAE